MLRHGLFAVGLVSGCITPFRPGPPSHRPTDGQNGGVRDVDDPTGRHTAAVREIVLILQQWGVDRRADLMEIPVGSAPRGEPGPLLLEALEYESDQFLAVDSEALLPAERMAF